MASESSVLLGDELVPAVPCECGDASCMLCDDRGMRARDPELDDLGPEPPCVHCGADPQGSFCPDGCTRGAL